MQKEVRDTDLSHLIKPATSLTSPTFIGPTEPRQKYLNPIENKGRDKPVGGFWTAPALDEPHTISPYSRHEDRILVQPDYEVWQLYPTEDATVIFIDTKEKLEQLPTYQPRYDGYKYLDYEQIFDNTTIDGLHIIGDIAHLKSFSKEHNLGSWDFSCTLWKSLDWINNKIKQGHVQEY